ncbi:DMT family transporter [Sandaracinobacteroides hominis]|uniref:DMT family transporter n=1 Tax=Sandaracinobacteroides hominis TaxID=2780086 RepID=UPI0018F39CD8|nr:EamA family transporter [Sandaracinobacteroides hominis]
MSARSILQFVLVVLIWGTTWYVITWQLGSVNPSWSVTYRFLVGGIALFGWCALRGLPLHVPRSSLPFIAIFGIMQFMLNFNFVYRAEQHVPSGIPAVAYALLMIPNAILAAIFLGRRASRRFIVGAMLGVTGVAMLFAQQLNLPGSRTETLIGLAFVTAGVLSASVSNVMQGSPQALRYPPLAGLAYAMLIGAGINAVFALFIAGPPQWDPSPQYWLGLLYLGVAASAVAFALYFDLIRQLGPAEAAWTGVPIPIVAMAISTVAEGYRWTPLAAAGAALAIFGLMVALWQPARKAQTA